MKISGDQKHISDDNKWPFKNITEELSLDYFNDNLNCSFKNTVSEKYYDAKITYPQTGLRKETRTNSIFKIRKEAVQIIEETTNNSIIPHSTYLFACESVLTEENAEELEKTIGADDFLKTDCYAVKSGEDDNAIVLFVKIDSGANVNYCNRLMERLDYLLSNKETVSKILSSGLFGQNLIMDFEKIRNYIRENGFQVIGYTAHHERTAADTIYDMVANRETDGISRLVEFNKSVAVFT